MLSTRDFVLQYETHNDEELYDIYVNSDDYSPEAQEALKIVIQKKGGLDELLHRLQQKRVYTAEVDRIGALATALAQQNIDQENTKAKLSSAVLSQEQVVELIDRAYMLVSHDREDRKIKPRTIVGGILATVIAAALGGIGWGLSLIYAPGISLKIVLVLLIGLVLLCYGLVKAFTRQSQKNVVVLIATIVSVLLSLLIGQLIATQSM